jgi:hypothetical protein
MIPKIAPNLDVLVFTKKFTDDFHRDNLAVSQLGRKTTGA